jgi:hypothetical protein
MCSEKLLETLTFGRDSEEGSVVQNGKMVVR